MRQYSAIAAFACGKGTQKLQNPIAKIDRQREDRAQLNDDRVSSRSHRADRCAITLRRCAGARWNSPAEIQSIPRRFRERSTRKSHASVKRLERGRVKRVKPLQM